MLKCEWCGKGYDEEEANNCFSTYTNRLSYENIKKNLCGECAVQAIEDEVVGVYIEKCEECGKKFDLFEESNEYDSNFSWANGTSLRDEWDDKIRCCDCALKIN